MSIKIAIVPLVLSFIFVIVGLVNMPGTVTSSKDKYILESDPKVILGTRQLSITILSLTLTLLTLIVAIVLIYRFKPVVAVDS